MLKQIRHSIINRLWTTHRQSMMEIVKIENALKAKGIVQFYLDHFAIIDLPGPHTGIPFLRDMFAAIGYVEQGKDYLADKQNDFVWMAEIDSANTPAKKVLPQVVVADFRFDVLPREIQAIIAKYAKGSQPSPLAEIKKLIEHLQINQNNVEITQHLINLFTCYFRGRDWPLPTVNEFHTVREFNELLAWALIHGRCPNHFTLSIHLLDQFQDLHDFHKFIETLGMTLNEDGGKIKGGETIGIAQGSTLGMQKKILLSDGYIELPSEFIEFVWRYPSKKEITVPHYWNDYFTGFIAQNANQVIESLYVNDLVH